jgi:bacterioferritin-associated ferredoxin
VIVCHCHRITDRDIRKLVADGAASTREVERACSAGLACGGCRLVVDELLRAERERTEAVPASELVPAF